MDGSERSYDKSQETKEDISGERSEGHVLSSDVE